MSQELSLKARLVWRQADFFLLRPPVRCGGGREPVSVRRAHSATDKDARKKGALELAAFELYTFIHEWNSETVAKDLRDALPASTGAPASYSSILQGLLRKNRAPHHGEEGNTNNPCPAPTEWGSEDAAGTQSWGSRTCSVY